MERPILFSTGMVRALLEGRKTQTRRIIKKQPHGPGYWVFQLGRWLFPNVCPNLKIKCPYGEPGDVLWVKETYTILEPEHCEGMHDRFYYKESHHEMNEEWRLECISNGYPYKWKPSIFMPKYASRIRLLIEDVRVERLKDITDEDCQAEGLTAPMVTDHPRGGWYIAYKSLWESINGIGSWFANPFVWVIKFKKL